MHAACQSLMNKALKTTNSTQIVFCCSCFVLLIAIFCLSLFHYVHKGLLGNGAGYQVDR